MRQIGVFTIIGGIIWIVIAYNMKTSVSGGPLIGEVVNIGLMNERQNHLMLGIGTVLAGVILTALGGRKSQPENMVQPLGAAPADAQAYGVWLSKKYGIEHNQLFNRYMVGNYQFDTLQQALDYAHESEQAAIAARELAEKNQIAAFDRVTKVAGGALVVAVVLMFLDQTFNRDIKPVEKVDAAAEANRAARVADEAAQAAIVAAENASKAYEAATNQRSKKDDVSTQKAKAAQSKSPPEPMPYGDDDIDTIIPFEEPAPVAKAVPAAKGESPKPLLAPPIIIEDPDEILNKP